MAVSAPPLDLLPDRSLLVGDQRIGDSSGGTYQHVYAATGSPTGEVPMAGAGIREFTRPKNVWIAM
jgi:hypothetical protein